MGVVRTLHSPTCPSEVGNQRAPEACLCLSYFSSEPHVSLSWRGEASDRVRTWVVSSFLIPPAQEPCANTMIPLPQVVVGGGCRDFSVGSALITLQPLAHFSCPDRVSGISEPDMRCDWASAVAGVA